MRKYSRNPVTPPSKQSVDSDGRRLVNRAVVKALTVLEHLLAYRSGRTLSQLSEDLNLPMSSVNDIIKTLVKMGYLQHDSESRRYKLTLKLTDLGQTYLHQTGLYTVSVPQVGQPSKRFDCVAAVYQFDRGARKLLLIEEEGGAPHLRFGWQIGSAILHCSAPGKVVLASLTSDEVAEILSVVGMPQLTPHTITNLVDLERDLALVRKQGYALDNQETFLGIGCIAIPITVRESPLAALTLRMPIERLEPEFITRSLELLLNTAAAIANGVTRTEPRTT
jgi:IclR family transcriptional regulator, KDG regulon repressor